MTRDKAIAFAEEQRPADRRQQEVAVLDRPERLGPRGGDRLPRGHLERPDRGRLLLHLGPGAPRDAPTRWCITFTAGVPIAIDGRPVTMLQAIEELNRAGRRAGRRPARHGRGPAGRHQEPRGVRGARARIALITAHQELENVTVERDLARFKRGVEQRWSRAGLRRAVVLARSSGRWTRSSPSSQEHVTGDVRVVLLHGGRAIVTGRRSAASLYDFELATYDAGRHLRPVAGQGLRRAVGAAEQAGRGPRPAGSQR